MANFSRPKKTLQTVQFSKYTSETVKHYMNIANIDNFLQHRNNAILTLLLNKNRIHDSANERPYTC